MRWVAHARLIVGEGKKRLASIANLDNCRPLMGSVRAKPAGSKGNTEGSTSTGPKPWLPPQL